MKPSNPLLLFPILHPTTDLASLSENLSGQQLQLLKFIDGHTSVAGLALLLGYPLESCQKDIDLFVRRGYVMLSHHAIERKPRRRHTTPPERPKLSKRPVAMTPPHEPRFPQSEESLSATKRPQQSTPSYPEVNHLRSQSTESLFSVPSGLYESISTVKANEQASSQQGHPISARAHIKRSQEHTQPSRAPSPNTERTQRMPIITEDMVNQTQKMPALRKNPTLQTPRAPMPIVDQTQKMPAIGTVQDLGKTQPDMAFPELPQQESKSTPTHAYPQLDSSQPEMRKKRTRQDSFEATKRRRFKREKTLPDLTPVPPYPSKKFTTKRLDREALEELVRKQGPIPKTSKKPSQTREAPTPSIENIKEGRTEEHQAFNPDKKSKN